jgi:hypothetical protein
MLAGGSTRRGEASGTETGGQNAAPARLANLLHAGFEAAPEQLTGRDNALAGANSVNKPYNSFGLRTYRKRLMINKKFIPFHLPRVFANPGLPLKINMRSYRSSAPNRLEFASPPRIYRKQLMMHARVDAISEHATRARGSGYRNKRANVALLV